MSRPHRVSFLGYRVLATVGFLSSCCVSHSFQGSKQVAAVMFGAVLGWIGPVLVVRRRARFRMSEVDRALPDLIDQVVVTLEAGVRFGNSLKLAADRSIGPLGEELRTDRCRSSAWASA